MATPIQARARLEELARSGNRRAQEILAQHAARQPAPSANVGVPNISFMSPFIDMISGAENAFPKPGAPQPQPQQPQTSPPWPFPERGDLPMKSPGPAMQSASVGVRSSGGAGGGLSVPAEDYQRRILEAADAGDVYARSLIQTVAGARAHALKQAASGAREQFVPVMDYRNDNLYIVNANGTTHVLNMRDSGDRAEYLRMLQKTGMDPNEFAQWSASSSKGLLGLLSPDAPNLDLAQNDYYRPGTQPEFGMSRGVDAPERMPVPPAGAAMPSPPQPSAQSVAEPIAPMARPSFPHADRGPQAMPSLSMPQQPAPTPTMPSFARQDATPLAPAPAQPRQAGMALDLGGLADVVERSRPGNYWRSRRAAEMAAR